MKNKNKSFNVGDVVTAVPELVGQLNWCCPKLRKQEEFTVTDTRLADAGNMSHWQFVRVKGERSWLSAAYFTKKKARGL